MPTGVGLYPHKRDNDRNFKDLHSLTTIITSWQPYLVWNLAAQRKGCRTSYGQQHFMQSLPQPP